MAIAQQPPRPLAPGDVVTTYCDELGEWAAAQIVHLDKRSMEVDVLDLDWSGPEPADVAALGELKPLRLSHHGAHGLAQMHREWVLPRSHRVVGNAPLLVSQPSSRFGSGWNTGRELALQRRWDSGDRGDPFGLAYLRIDSGALSIPGRQGPRPEVRHLAVDVERLDCSSLVQAFPNLTSLELWGSPGWVAELSALNRLGSLRKVTLVEIFGMTPSDRLDPIRMTNLEFIALSSIPSEFAYAMKRTWSPEQIHGVFLTVSKPRQHGWVEENLNNPLRDWQGRDGMPSATYKKSLNAWARTTRPMREALRDPEAVGADLVGRLAQLGTDFARAFDAVSGPSHRITSQERDELLEALHHLVLSTPGPSTIDRDHAAAAVLQAVNGERSW